MRQDPANHRVAVIAFDGVVSFDLAMPCEVFSRVPGYQLAVCAATRDVDAGAFRIQVEHGLGELARADTIIVPGVTDLDRPVPTPLLGALRRAAARGARVASICTGAFLLAAAGLLDGRRATTHWFAAGELTRRYPKIDVDADALYVDEGAILTSAGAAAGLDLCLHLVRRDHGAAVAADAARFAVVPLERDGGQSQFITRPLPARDDASLAPLLRWLDEHHAEDLTLETIAAHARLSVRTLTRRFKEETSTTPLQWLLRTRVRRAQRLLESTSRSIEHIATDVGFGSLASFRDHFRRVVSTSPQRYRQAFTSART